MRHNFFSRKVPTAGGPKQEIAQFNPLAGKCFRDSTTAGSVFSSADCSSKLSVVFCQHRYPSPCRSVPTQNRPAYPFWLIITDLATNRFMWFKTLESTERSVNVSGSHLKQKGTITCLKKLGSSPQLQHLALPDVLKQIPNVRLWVPVSAALPAKRWATTTASKARLLVGLSAHFLATLPAAKTLTRLIEFERRRGLAPAAFSV